MLSRNKYDKFFYKIVKINNKLKVSSPIAPKASPKLNEQEILELGELRSTVNALRAKILSYSTLVEELQDKIKTAKFPEDIATIKKNAIIIDSSAVTRAKLKKLLDPDSVVTFLPRDQQEAEKMLKENIFNIAIIEFGSPENYGLNLINSINSSAWLIMPKIILSTPSENITIPCELFHLISGVIPKPWDDDIIIAKFKELLE